MIDICCSGVIYKNPLCLEDCFAKDHCVTRLFNDYKQAGGICDGAAVIESVAEYTFAPPGTCILTQGPEIWTNIISKGICSAETEAALSESSCIYDAVSRGPAFWETLWRLISLTCTTPVATAWYNVETWLIEGRPQQPKLNPISLAIHEPNLGEIFNWVPEFENTRNRYPWICSLRSKDVSKTHYCAATLLKRPPGPIVMVTTAHCTYLCKSEDGGVQPNCCCENVRKGFIN